MRHRVLFGVGSIVLIACAVGHNADDSTTTDGGGSDGSVTTNEIERLLDVELSRADIRSIGGYVVEQLGHFPKPGESFETEGLLFTAEKVVEHAVEQVRITRIPPAPEAEPAPAKRKRARSSGESNKPKDRNA
jgi:hypothetical protein